MALQSLRPQFLDIQHAPEPADRMARLAAALLTSVLYLLFALLFWRSFLTVPIEVPRPEITANLLPEAASRKMALPPIPFVAHMIRPRVEDMALPQFTVQPERTATQATLPTAAPPASSPLRGGAQMQDAPGMPVSAAGSNANASATTGCLDGDWVRAVNARLLGSFHYPARARMLGITGEVHLRFTVERDGSFSTLAIDKPSGFLSLDVNAIGMMKKAQPLPAIPARMHVSRVNGVLVLLFGQQSAGTAGPLLTCN